MSLSDFVLPALVNLSSHELRDSDEDFKQAINKIFELLFKLERFLLMESWLALFEQVFERLFRSLHVEFMKKGAAADDFKEIMLFCFKSVYNLIIHNKIRPIELLSRNFAVLREIADAKHKAMLDCLTLNLNDDINETVKACRDNPWIDQIWAQIIDYIAHLFDANFPSEAS